jgi:hypothetical protein
VDRADDSPIAEADTARCARYRELPRGLIHPKGNPLHWLGLSDIRIATMVLVFVSKLNSQLIDFAM